MPKSDSSKIESPKDTGPEFSAVVKEATLLELIQQGTDAKKELAKLSATKNTAQSTTKNTAKNTTKKTKLSAAIKKGAEAKKQLIRLKEEIKLSDLIKKGDAAKKALEALESDKSNKSALADKKRQLKNTAQKGKDASDKLVKANMGLVVSIANGYANSNALLQDLIQEGNLALVTAAHRFDASKGYFFSTYAYSWIESVIKRFANSQNRTLKMSAGQIERQIRLGRMLKEFEERHQRIPTPKEISQELELKQDEVVELLKVRSAQFSSVSLDAAIDYADEHPSVEDVIADADLTEHNLADVLSIVTNLSNLDRDILTARFGLDGSEPMTVDEVAKQKSVARERIRHLETRALAQIRIQFERKKSKEEQE